MRRRRNSTAIAHDTSSAFTGWMSRRTPRSPRPGWHPRLRSAASSTRGTCRPSRIAMKKFLLLAATLLSLSLATGCASMADATASRGTGTSHVYDQPFDKVWDALDASVRETDLTIVSEDKAAGTLLAKRSMT